MTGSVYLLGSIQDQPAIVHVTKTMLDSSKAVDIVNNGLDELQVYLVNQPVSDRIYHLLQMVSSRASMEDTSLPSDRLTIATIVLLGSWTSRPYSRLCSRSQDRSHLARDRDPHQEVH